MKKQVKGMFLGFLAGLLLLAAGSRLHAAVRVVSWNMLMGEGTQMADVTLEYVFKPLFIKMGEQEVNGVTRPFDILVGQELASNKKREIKLYNLLNSYYGADTYRFAQFNTFGDGWNYNGMMYNYDQLELIEEVNFYPSGGGPRGTSRYRLRIRGYGPDADIFIYNTHYKAFDGEYERVRRASDARGIRWHSSYGSDKLPEGSNVIYAGDFNQHSDPTQDCSMGAGDVTSLGGYDNPWYYLVMQEQYPPGSGSGYYTSGNGQGVDPAGYTTPVYWSDNLYHSWSVANLQSRLDLQVVTHELYDGEGVSLIAPGVGDSLATENSYRVFGNNGTHGYRCGIFNASCGTVGYYDMEVPELLSVASDHLPVIADYQRPAKMQVSITMPVDEPFEVGESVMAEILVENIADVSGVAGADELDYEIIIHDGGTLIGSEFGMDQPLNSGNVHQVVLDTFQPGEFTLDVEVISTSQAVANGHYQNTFVFEVSGNGITQLQELVGVWMNDDNDAGWDPSLDYFLDGKIDFLDFMVLSLSWM